MKHTCMLGTIDSLRVLLATNQFNDHKRITVFMKGLEDDLVNIHLYCSDLYWLDDQHMDGTRIIIFNSALLNGILSSP